MSNSSELACYLSGGTANQVPSVSLGGSISTQLLSPDPVNNLFADISSENTVNGYTDYACVFFSNISDSETLQNAQVYMLPKALGSTQIALGTLLATEQQQIIVSQVSSFNTNNSFTLKYESIDFAGTAIVDYDSDINQWAANMQSVLSGIGGLSDITVAASLSVTNTVFLITFGGSASNRSHPLLQIMANNLEGAKISVNRIQQGSPINALAPSTTNATSPPAGITFVTPTQAAPLVIGNLYPSDYFFIWFERYCPPGLRFPGDGMSVIFTAASQETFEA